MSIAISAQGTIIARQPLGAGPFVDIAELRDTTPPPRSRNVIETTSHNEQDDTAVVGIRRTGELAFTIGWVPSSTTHNPTTGLMKSFIGGDLDVFRITFPDASTWLFSGYVTNVGPSAPVDDGLTADISIKPTGAMTIT
jgi:hypothetical protein